MPCADRAGMRCGVVPKHSRAADERAHGACARIGVWTMHVRPRAGVDVQIRMRKRPAYPRWIPDFTMRRQRGTIRTCVRPEGSGHGHGWILAEAWPLFTGDR